MKVDMSKKYKTRDGSDVRLYADDAGGRFPIHGAVKRPDDTWARDAWTADGRWTWPGGEGCDDLVEVKPRIKRRVWVLLYPDGTTNIANSERTAQALKTKAIACIPVDIDCEEGEGL